MKRAISVCLLVVIAAGIGSVEGQGKTVIKPGVEEVITGLSGPVRLVAPVSDDRLFVVERGGLVRVFNQDGTSRGTFLDISSMTTTQSERGLLGLAFDPDYANSGRFYINYTDLDGNTQIARYTVSPDSDLANAGSAEILLSIIQPFANHNAGHLEFGPDGMLYIAMGDGGSGNDPQNNAQNDQTLLGKMLRIDVSAPSGYTIPADNPHVGNQEGILEEIWAKGLRNPWCFSFDRQTGDLYIADVGQNLWEEINVQPAASVGGENYGWRLMEATHCFNPATNCNDGSLTLPVHEYAHGGSPSRCSIAGGYVYRGALAENSLGGLYLFADYCSREILALSWNGSSSGVYNFTADLTPPAGYGLISAFGQDGHGEIYILDLSRGTVHRIIDDSSIPTQPRSIGSLKSNWR